jgi:hypothetical protein
MRRRYTPRFINGGVFDDPLRNSSRAVHSKCENSLIAVSYFTKTKGSYSNNNSSDFCTESNSDVLQVNNPVRRDRKQRVLGRHQRLMSPVVCTTSHRSRRDNESSKCEVAVMPLCDSDVMFRSADKRFAEVWMTVLGGGLFCVNAVYRSHIPS